MATIDAWRPASARGGSLRRSWPSCCRNVSALVLSRRESRARGTALENGGLSMGSNGRIGDRGWTIAGARVRWDGLVGAIVADAKLHKNTKITPCSVGSLNAKALLALLGCDQQSSVGGARKRQPLEARATPHSASTYPSVIHCIRSVFFFLPREALLLANLCLSSSAFLLFFFPHFATN